MGLGRVAHVLLKAIVRVRRPELEHLPVAGDLRRDTCHRNRQRLAIAFNDTFVLVGPGLQWAAVHYQADFFWGLGL